MTTRREIPQGLRIVFLANFVFTFIFGIAGTFLAKFVGDIANHQVRDVDVNVMLGVASLGFSIASWLAYKATTWEQINIVALMSTFVNLFGGIGGLIGFFVPSVFGITEPYPPVQLIVSLALTALGIAFAYFYFAPARSTATAPQAGTAARAND